MLLFFVFIETADERLTHNMILSRRLGTVVTTPYPLAAAGGKRGYYFIFPELYVATAGTFRLRFALYDIRR